MLNSNYFTTTENITKYDKTQKVRCRWESYSVKSRALASRERTWFVTRELGLSPLQLTAPYTHHRQGTRFFGFPPSSLIV